MNKALNNPQKTPKPLSKTTTIGLMVLFVGPMIMAGILYYLEPQLKLSSHQVGTLLSPPIPAAALNLNPDPIPTTPWRLLYYTPNCNNIALCSVSLEKMERLRAGLGKNASRVSTYLVSQMPPAENIPLQTWQHIARIQQLPTSLQSIQTGGFLIIDPMGFVIMYYPADTPVNAMLRDVRHLLQVSQIG